MTRLARHVSEIERQWVTERLYLILDRLNDPTVSREQIGRGIQYMAQTLWPPWSEVEDEGMRPSDDRPVNLEAA